MQKIIMKEMDIGKLKPARYNPRKNLQPGDAEYEALKKSIERWDLVEPLVWNESTGNLVGGHQRLMAPGQLEQCQGVDEPGQGLRGDFDARRQGRKRRCNLQIHA